MTETTCEQAILSALKSAAPEIGAALGALFEKVFSSSNISKYCSCSSTDGSDSNDNKSTNTSGTNGSSNSKNASAPSKDETSTDPVSKTPASDDTAFVDYPEKFTESAGVSAQSVNVTKWSLLR